MGSEVWSRKAATAIHQHNIISLHHYIGLEQDHHHNGNQGARRLHILCSICIRLFEALTKAVRLFVVSLRSQPMYSQTCSTDIFVDLQSLGCNFKRAFINPSAWGVRVTWGLGSGSFDSPCRFLLAFPWHLPVVCYLFIWLKKRSRPSAEPDAMTTTALKAIASSIGKKTNIDPALFALCMCIQLTINQLFVSSRTTSASEQKRRSIFPLTVDHLSEIKRLPLSIIGRQRKY